MSDGGFTPRQKASGRQNYLVFQIFNVISFTMLSGSVLTLYSLKLGADSFFIGALSALINFGFLMIVAGRQSIKRLGARKQWALSWLLRNVCMVPVLFAPAASAAGRPALTLLLILVPFFGFNFFKGTGLVGVNPMMGSLSAGKDRGSFLAKAQINVHLILIGTNLIMAFFLGPNAGIQRYIVLIATGIGMGIFSTTFLFRLPNPKLNTSGSENTLISSIKRGIRRPEFRFFITLASAMALITGMANPFLVVYAKKVYGLDDNLVVLFLVVGNVGVIISGLLARRLIDRMGGKMLYLLFLGVLSVGVVLIIVSPELSRIPNLIYLGGLFFVYNFGFLGGTNSAQNYFYSITNTDEQLNLGLLNSALSGTAGAAGSLVGGILLGTLESAVALPASAFRLFFAIVFILLLFCFPLVFKLKNTGQYSVRTSLEVFLSRRNLRAVALLHKLDTSRTVGEEVEIIDSLASSNSPVVVQDLLDRLRSPRFYIRSHALRALENLPLDDSVSEALITQVKNHAFTTAHVAARIMGRKNIRSGIRVLRSSLKSDDYLLQAESALALARMGDKHSIRDIKKVLSASQNPLVQIYAASALGILGATDSLPLLFEALRSKASAPYFRDEIILSIADLLGIGDWFYPYYTDFLERAKDGIKDLLDYLADCDIDVKQRRTLSSLLNSMRSDREAFQKGIYEYLASRVDAGPGLVSTLVEAAGDSSLLRLDRLAFLLAAVTARLECGWDE